LKNSEINWIQYLFGIYTNSDFKSRYVKRFAAIVLLTEIPQVLGLLKGKSEHDKVRFVQLLFQNIDDLERPIANTMPKKDEQKLQEFIKEFEADIKNKQINQDLPPPTVIQSDELNSFVESIFMSGEKKEDKVQNNKDNIFSSRLLGNRNQNQNIFESVILQKPKNERKFNVKKSRFFKTIDYVLSFSEKSLTILTNGNVETLFFYTQLNGYQIETRTNTLTIICKSGEELKFICNNKKELLSISKLLIAALDD